VAIDTVKDPYSDVASLLAGSRPKTAYGAPGTSTPSAPTYSANSTANALAGPPTTQGTTPAPAPSPTPPDYYTSGGQGQGKVPELLAGGNQGFLTALEARDPYWRSVYEGLDASSAADLKDYIAYVKTWPKYKGSQDAERVAIANYARQLKMMAKNSGANDYSGIAKLGDENRSLQDQMAARLAASGHAAGGGVAAGAYSNLSAKTSAAVADYLNEQDAQKRKEKLAIVLAQMQNDQRMQEYALQRKYQEDNDPGILGDIAGLIGQIAPIVIGGAFGGPGGAVAGAGVGKGARAIEPSPFM
jgi:hypothetical protein